MTAPPERARERDRFPRYRGYLILPFVHAQPFLIDGQWVNFGYHVTSHDGTINVLPGATWGRTIEQARTFADALLAVGGGPRGELPEGAAAEFWKIIHSQRGQESTRVEDAP